MWVWYQSPRSKTSSAAAFTATRNNCFLVLIQVLQERWQVVYPAHHCQKLVSLSCWLPHTIPFLFFFLPENGSQILTHRGLIIHNIKSNNWHAVQRVMWTVCGQWANTWSCQAINTTTLNKMNALVIQKTWTELELETCWFYDCVKVGESRIEL